MNEKNNKKDLKTIIYKEVVNDYYTAGIKAEVILDMLLRPELERVLGRLGYPGIKFITKEFPIPTAENDTHNCNVDYLMYDENLVYLIELKTSSTSEDKKQLENYIDHIFNEKNKGKSFRELFGERFIWLLNYVSKSGRKSDNESGKSFDGNEWGKLKKQLKKDKDEDCLLELFDKIISSKDKDIMYDKEVNFSQKAMRYLKKYKKTGSQKYLYQAGQILDSKPGEWWDKSVRLVYIVPDEGTIKKKIKTNLERLHLEEHEDDIKIISIEKITKELKSQNGSDPENEYDAMLISILEDIFGAKGKNNDADN